MTPTPNTPPRSSSPGAANCPSGALPTAGGFPMDEARERVWVVAYSNEVGRRGFGERHELFDGLRHYQQRLAPPPLQGRHDVERRLLALVADRDGDCPPETRGRNAHGVSEGLDGFAALGNSVVPQIPELIGRAIVQARAAA